MLKKWRDVGPLPNVTDVDGVDIKTLSMEGLKVLKALFLVNMISGLTSKPAVFGVTSSIM